MTADVVVIGAGHNALISAAYLAAAGLEVVVLEERDLVGGNTITEELTLPGYRHDSCSSAHVLLQSNPLIRDDELGLKRLGLQYVHTDPAVILPFQDGSSFVMHRDGERTAEEIARWSEADAAAFLQLLRDWRDGLSGAHARWNNGTLDPANNTADARYDELRSGRALETIGARFSHPRTVDAMAWLSFATIQRVNRPGTGILPFSITAGRTNFGWSTPIGGSGALPDALARSIEKNGGAVYPGHPVERILLEGGRAAGVQTADGQVWRARRAVLSSAHLSHLPAMLGAVDVPPALAAAASSWRPGLSLFAAHFATTGQVTYSTEEGPVASVAGGLGSVSGMLTQYEAFDRGEWDAADPWLLIVCSTVVDPDRAPHGHGTVKFLTIAPYQLSGGRDWGAERERYLAALLDHASHYVGGLSSTHVLAQVAESPTDLERRNRHNVGGSCHGGEFLRDSGEVLVRLAGSSPSDPGPVPDRIHRPSGRIGRRSLRTQRGPSVAGRSRARPEYRDGPRVTASSGTFDRNRLPKGDR